MGAMAARRCVEWLLGVYFVLHIPITMFIDVLVVLPPKLYPQKLSNLLQWYFKEFKDPLMQDPPVWFKSLVVCELVFQLPFFPIAAYAFFKGNCRWIRIPAIIYAVHTITTLIPILSTLLLEDFSKAVALRPKNFRERLTLIAVYVPYLIIPIILLLFMLRNPYYKNEEKRKRK
ncbi:Sigma intracellular receptor 2 [Lemmus lemmus]